MEAFAVLTRNVVIVGAGKQGERLLRHIKDNQGDLAVHPMAVFTLDPDLEGNDILGVPVVGGIKDLLLYVRNNHVQEIMVALPWDREDDISDVLITSAKRPSMYRWLRSRSATG